MARSQRPASIPINGHSRINGFTKGLKGWDDARDWREVRDEAGPVRLNGKAGGPTDKGEPPPKVYLKPEDVRPKSPGQAAFMDALRANRVVFGVGVAGTGKTHLAVWNAVRLLQLGEVDSISFFRPAIEMGAKLGFMPGTKQEKIEHYMAPLMGELAKFHGPAEIKRMIRDGVLRMEALQFLRGQNLERTAGILDEGQNATLKEIQAYLTRLCEGSHFAILGDVSRNEPGHPDGPVLKQSDLPPHMQGGLEYYAGKFLHLKGVARVEMTSVDVARDPLVRAMLEAGL
jgi:phosphate starvation-inducible PhoH-like protein